MKEKTILEMQAELEAALQQLPTLVSQLPEALRPLARLAPREGLRVEVSLRHAKNERQVKRNSPADRWSPSSGVISVSYKASPTKQALAAETADPARDVVMSLAKAEMDPQLGFVSLKWFRDTYLVRQGYSWAAATDERQRVLVNTIERNWILTSRVPNPKNPRYPVTAIKVNRPLPEVRRILDQEPGFRSTFHPIEMPGEPLSQTVLRERR
jgi:hypothetical protein